MHLSISKPLNSPPSICAKYRISSKLEDLPFLVENCGTRCSTLTGPTRQQVLQLMMTIEFATLTLCRVRNFIKIETFAVPRPKLWPNRWQVPKLTGIKNYKKLLSSLNSPPSICAENKTSLKLKHLPFFIQNYGLKDDRCQYWQVSRITENYCHQWIQHLQIVHYATFRWKWLTLFPVPRSLSFLKIASSCFMFIEKHKTE